MSSYILSTQRLGLRKWLDSDIRPFTAMNMDVDVMKYFPNVVTEAETLEMITRIGLNFEKNNFGLFAVEHLATKQFIGFTGFSIPRFESFFTPCIEIGWRYKKEVWGQGFATEAAAACLNYGFKTLKFDKVVSFTSSININSKKVMERIGMKYVTSFDHPNIDKTSTLCRHVLYEINNEQNS
jgi:[ribosomal protein S5]-alanine N-acetyltransferase